MSFGYSELENNNQQASILSADIAAQTTPGIERAPFSIKNELKVTQPLVIKFQIYDLSKTEYNLNLYLQDLLIILHLFLGFLRRRKCKWKQKTNAG